MRFFRDRKPAAEPAPPAPEEAGAGDEDDAAAEALAAYDGEPEAAIDELHEWRTRAAAVIPGGASTGSKRPDALYGDGAQFGPTHFVRASGCELVTPAGERLVDCTMALGAVSLGYADEGVSRAVVETILGGHVAGLSHGLEVVVAERLCEVVPCAEQVRFPKTGAEAVAAAVRIARTYTGRSTVIGAGYFGWLDWWTEAKGVPAGAHADFHAVPFDDVAALERAVAAAGSALAAVVIEPVVERLPSDEWVRAARAACDRVGAVLIFDEIKTGFRLRPGGFQEHSGLTPDLATFGKAMANGFPLAAVVGRADVMDAARATWISSTLAGEAAALAAAGAVLDRHAEEDVCTGLASIGAEMMAAARRAVAASGVPGVRVEGIAPMWLLRFADPTRESHFLEAALGEGVLFKRGAYNFPSLAHDEDALVQIERAASTALVTAREAERRR
ncbi:MAG TPA: aminotransferase class III-fold pyridoxal phosphate-dependent enzyme [Gemmatimonadaceae bacterium]|nr:aminotransferase class III-fold pyridoxal phosphate-dependent enzyme [Gemmatimonadaceae bacterium]